MHDCSTDSTSIPNNPQQRTIMLTTRANQHPSRAFLAGFGGICCSSYVFRSQRNSSFCKTGPYSTSTVPKKSHALLNLGVVSYLSCGADMLPCRRESTVCNRHPGQESACICAPEAAVADVQVSASLCQCYSVPVLACASVSLFQLGLSVGCCLVAWFPCFLAVLLPVVYGTLTRDLHHC